MRAVLFIAIAVAGCGSGTGTNGDAGTGADQHGMNDHDAALPNTPTYSTLRKRIFPGCRGESCHAATPPDLDDLATLVNVPAVISPAKRRVVPFQPDQSFLYQKVTAMLTNSEGDPMPANGPLLPAEEIKLIRDWIAGGALDN